MPSHVAVAMGSGDGKVFGIGMEGAEMDNRPQVHAESRSIMKGRTRRSGDIVPTKIQKTRCGRIRHMAIGAVMRGLSIRSCRNSGFGADNRLRRVISGGRSDVGV